MSERHLTRDRSANGAHPRPATGTAAPRPQLRHFIDIADIDRAALRRILDAAHAMKKAGKRVPKRFQPKDIADQIMAMIFEKHSTRTRISFDVAMRQLGGGTISLAHTDLQLGRGESIADTARVVSRYVDAVVIRANAHATVTEFAQNATIPVINGLTDQSHPCQILADLMTLEERRGAIEGETVAWVGDGNNVAVSWIEAAAKFKFKLRIACPGQLSPDPAVLKRARGEGGDITVTDEPDEAVRGAGAVVTDTWVSMGQTDATRRKQLLSPYSVDQSLMSKAVKDAIFLHCLPAYRGHEVSAEVIDGPQSAVLDEAENRLHAQKAILAYVLGGL